MIGYAKKIEKIIRQSAFDKKKKKSGLKFNPGLALTRVRTTRPCSGRLRPGSKSFMVFMYSFQKQWLKTPTRDVIW